MDYLIKNTTREQRIKLVKNALGMVITDDRLPSDDAIKLVNKYINGEMELEEVKNKIIEKYNKGI